MGLQLKPAAFAISERTENLLIYYLNYLPSKTVTFPTFLPKFAQNVCVPNKFVRPFFFGFLHNQRSVQISQSAVSIRTGGNLTESVLGNKVGARELPVSLTFLLAICVVWIKQHYVECYREKRFFSVFLHRIVTKTFRLLSTTFLATVSFRFDNLLQITAFGSH